MKTFESRLAQLINRFSIPILVIILGITGFFGIGVSRVEIARNFDDSSMPNNHPLIRSIRDVRKTFGDHTRQVVLTLEAEGGHLFHSDTGIKLIHQATEALKTVPTVKAETLLSISTISDVKSDDESLTSEVLVKEYLNGKIQNKELVSRIQSNDLVFGRLISPDWKTSLVIASADWEVDLTTLHNQMETALEPLRKEFPDFKISNLGDPEITYQLQTAIEKELVVLLSLAVLCLILGFYLIYRNWQGVVIPLSSTLISIVWIMGLIGFYGEAIHMISSTIPIVMIVVGSSCAIHTYTSLLRQKKRSEDFVTACTSAIHHIFSPLTLAALTTTAGGLSLLTFKIHPLRHFGVSLACGTIIAVTLALIVIPCLVRLAWNTKLVKANANSSITNTTKKSGQGDFITQGLRKIGEFSVTYPKTILLSALVVLIIGARLMNNIEMGFDYVSQLPKGHSVRLAAENLDKAFGGVRQFEVMIEAKKDHGAVEPSFIKKLTEFETEALKIPRVTNSLSLVNMVEQVHHALNPKLPLGTLPNSADQIAQYLMLLSMSGESKKTLGNFLTSDEKKVKLILNVNASDTRQAEPLYEELRKLGERVFGDEATISFGGQLVFSIAFLDYLVWGKIQNILLSLLLVLLIVMIRYRSMARGLLSAATLVFGVVVTFAMMSLAGIRLDFVSAIITSIAMGMGIDFNIYFLDTLTRQVKNHPDLKLAVREALRDSGRPILFNGIANMVGFGILFISKFSSISMFAELICFNMGVLMLGTFLLMPALAVVFKPRFLRTEKELEQPMNLNPKFRCFASVAAGSVAIAALCVGIYVIEARAGNDDAQTILKKAMRSSHPKNEESVYLMKLIGRDGNESIRKMKVWFKSNESEDIKLLIKFEEPANIRGTGFLTIAEKGKTPEQWLYLPSLKKSRKIIGGGADESFLGSDFSMADISSTSQDDDSNVVMKPEQKIDGVAVQVIEVTPKPGKESLYSKKIFYIQKEGSMTKKGEFYNKAGQIEKVMTANGIKKHPSGQWLADSLEMKNLLTEHRTVIEFVERDVTKVPADSVFTKGRLEK